MNNPRALGYVRVSQEREDMISPELQTTAIREHCTRHGYQLGEIIVDLDLSGRFWKRRQMERVVGMIEAHEADVVVVWKMSRVSRNRMDWAIALDRVESAGGRLESATEPIDTTTSSGRFSRGILAELAAFESERAGEQWSETHRRRWSRGMPHSGKPRFGYVRTAEAFVVDPVAADVVREMFARYLRGDGLLPIAQWLNTLALPHAPISPSGVASFLRNGFAAGYLVHHNPECKGPHVAGRRCTNLIREIGTHDPIVDPRLYALLQTETDRRRKIAPRHLNPVSTLSGIVFCGTCERGMSRHVRAGGSAPYFRCIHPECPRHVSIVEHAIEAAVVAWLPTVADAISARATSIPLRASTVRAEQESLARVATRSQEAINNLTRAFALGKVPEESYAVVRAELEAERDDAARRSSQLLGAAARSAANQTLAVDLLDAWDKITPAARNRILRALCRVRVTPPTIPRANRRPDAEVVPFWLLDVL